MEKIKDKIYDVYYSDVESNFQKKVRERIHWICRNVTGNQVLDIGCSQGITSILLGREGKKVLGLDLSDSTIQEANKNLEKEEEETRNCVQFEKCNFMLKDFNQQYDCVILGEVLEHINDIESFFNKASSLINENGKLIVTTPFGINDFIDHKRTFYLNDLLKLQSEDITIKEIEFFGKWIGVVYTKNELESVKNVDEELLSRLEKAFYEIERDLLTSQRKLKAKYKSNNEIANNKVNQSGDLGNDKEDYYQKYIDEKVEKVKFQKRLLEEYKKEESLLNENKELMNKIDRLEKRYFSLKNSKLGRITTRYWDLRNRKRRS